MIKSVKKIPVLRYGLIVLLVSILFSGAFYLYLHYNSARKLQGNISKLITARENSELIDSCLLNLYNADNNSRLYALTGDKFYIRRFSEQIKSLNDLLAKIKFGDISTVGSERLKKLVTEKTKKTGKYIQLRLLTDSLIRTTSKIDSTLAYSRNIKIPVPVTRTIKTTVHYDTIKNEPKLAASAPTKRKNFLGRIIAAIARKKDKEKAVASPIVIKQDTLTKTVIQPSTIYTAIPKKTRNYYRKLYNANNRLRSNEQDILLINNRLVIDIIAELKRYKNLELAYANESKAELAGKVTNVFEEYTLLSQLTLAALILLIIVVLYNVWKLFDNDREIIDESDKAKRYADNKSRFMANMSHEIRTPLNSVIGFSEQLSTGKLDTDQNEQINAIRNSSQMLLEVVNEILDFSKYETGKMNFEQQPFMLHNALMKVLDSVQIQAAKKGLALKKSFAFDKNVCFSGDVLRLKQVVMNLLVNAIKFTPTGEILLQAMLIPQKDNNAILKIRVKDTGIGIKRHDLPMIFDEFSQVTDAQKVTRHKGTGLGLAICKKIVELQGGSIKVISEKGKGSVFSFELPFIVANKEDCPIENVISDDDLILKVSGAHVLLAEDNQLNVLLAKTILKKWHITFDIAYNGQEAIDLFNEHHYDMVLTDIQMPIMNGLELLALIRKAPNNLKSETPVLALTANVLKEDRDIYKSAGMDDIVLKPFVERTLIEKISKHLKTRYNNTDNLLFRYG
jgi:signal transduction histidine kinase